MKHLTDYKGGVYEVDDLPLNEGGQGIIWKVKNRPGYVAKLYKPDKIYDGLEEKLLAMVSHPAKPPIIKGHRFVSWPEAVLYEKSGVFVGYLMPEMAKIYELVQFTIPKERKKISSGFTRKYLYSIASNLAKTVNAVHELGHIIGDINPGNFLIDANCQVTIIDTDSFQITAGQKLYPCPVNRLPFQAPEIHNSKGNYKDITKNQHHDCFGLAVLIFNLLCEGAHPFNGKLSSGKMISNAEEYLHKKGCFPYIKNSEATPPKGSLFLILPPRVKDAFIQTFGEGSQAPSRRVSAKTWIDLLGDVAQNGLTVCSNDSLHTFESHLPGCPECISKNPNKNAATNQAGQIKMPSPPISAQTQHPTSSPPQTPRPTSPTASTTSTYTQSSSSNIALRILFKTLSLSWTLFTKTLSYAWSLVASVDWIQHLQRLQSPTLSLLSLLRKPAVFTPLLIFGIILYLVKFFPSQNDSVTSDTTPRDTLSLPISDGEDRRTPFVSPRPSLIPEPLMPEKFPSSAPKKKVDQQEVPDDISADLKEFSKEILESYRRSDERSREAEELLARGQALLDRRAKNDLIEQELLRGENIHVEDGVEHQIKKIPFADIIRTLQSSKEFQALEQESKDADLHIEGLGGFPASVRTLSDGKRLFSSSVLEFSSDQDSEDSLRKHARWLQGQLTALGGSWERVGKIRPSRNTQECLAFKRDGKTLVAIDRRFDGKEFSVCISVYAKPE